MTTLSLPVFQSWRNHSSPASSIVNTVTPAPDLMVTVLGHSNETSPDLACRALHTATTSEIDNRRVCKQNESLTSQFATAQREIVKSHNDY